MAKRKSLDPDDVIAGRIKPGVADLLDLIHRENPTGRDVSPREAELRYARKARLQSVLVRRFADELDVTADPERPGTVSLLHRGHGRDGCHAILASLDDDARSWVQRALDLAEPAVTEPVPSARPSKRGAPRARDSMPSARPSERGAPPPAVGDVALAETPEELLRQGEAALEAYDYEVAQAALTRATEASGGAAGPAMKLLTLLVETLGDDAAALAVEPTLSRAAMADPRVRGPLALAAARAGDEERALGLLNGIGDADAATALASLSARALATGDLERAAKHIDQARRHDPTNPAVRAVAGDVAKARAAEREPFEAEIRALLETGDDAAAEKRADDLLARWPDSEAARRAKHGIEERRRAAREAEVRRAREMEAAARERRDTERVEAAIRLLEGADVREGLIAYSTLEPPLRERARLRGARPEIAWIDAMPSARPAALVDAAMALAEARALLPHDPDAALARLAPHTGLLERVGEAGRVTRAAESILRGRRLEYARAAVEAARADLAEGKASEALARLTAETLRELPKEERAIAAEIEAAATQRVDRRRRKDDVGRRRAEGRLFEARAIAEGLAEGAGEAERAWCLEARDAIQADIQREFRVDVCEDPRPAGDLGRHRHVFHIDSPWWLTPDGRAVVLAHSHDRWVIVRVLDLETRTVRPTVVLRTPEAMGDLETTVCGTTLWLVGIRGAFAEIDMVTWRILDYASAEAATGMSVGVEHTLLVAPEDGQSPAYLWVARRTGGELVTDAVKVIDLAHRRPVRELPGVWRAMRIGGPAGPRPASLKNEVVTLHTPRGALATPGRLDLRPPRGPLSLAEIAAHPAGDGFAALVGPPMFDEFHEMNGDRSLFIALLTATGTLSALEKIPDADCDQQSRLAVSRESGRLHAIVRPGGPILLSASCDDGKIIVRSRVEINDETILVGDAGARRVAALTLHDEGVDVALLGTEPPDIPRRPARTTVRIPGALDVSACDHPSGPRNARALALSASWRNRPHGEVQRQIHELMRADPAEPDDLLDALFALRETATGERFDDAQDLLEHLALSFPDNPEVRLLVANRHAVERKWAEAGAALEDVVPGDLDERRAKHVHHLRAIIAFNEGRFADIGQETAAANLLEGPCSMQSLEDLGLSPLKGGTAGPLAQLLHLVRAADERFAAGDPAGALRLLDVALVWKANELQSLARLSEAYLTLATETFDERLRKLTTLGTLLDCHAQQGMLARNFASLPGAWSGERLDDTVARARAWLEAMGAPAAHPATTPQEP